MFEEGVGGLLVWPLGRRHDIGLWWSEWDSGLGLGGWGTESTAVLGGGSGRARQAWG